jgi:hypothetical protein
VEKSWGLDPSPVPPSCSLQHSKKGVRTCEETRENSEDGGRGLQGYQEPQEE